MIVEFKCTYIHLNTIARMIDGVSDKVYFTCTSDKTIRFVSLNPALWSCTSMQIKNIPSLQFSGVFDSVQFKRKLISIPQKCKNIVVKIFSTRINIDYMFKNCNGSFDIEIHSCDPPMIHEHVYEYSVPLSPCLSTWLKSLHVISDLQDSIINLQLMSKEWRVQSNNHGSSPLLFKQVYKLHKQIITNNVHDNVGIYLQVSESLIRFAINRVPGKQFLQSGYGYPLAIHSIFKGMTCNMLIRPLYTIGVA